MNKTVSINLGGFFFHIDEDAFQKLNKYFDAIKRSLFSDGRDEIMKDIENRISELFSEKLSSNKQVISLKEVDDIIAIMGQPEDYKIENDQTTDSQTNNNYYTKSKKLYRDKDNGILGGVLAGLGHYLGIDKVWLRVFMLFLFFIFGTGLLLYIILWIITPKAITTTEKLEMMGEPINISNIEKKVRSEFENVSEKFKNADYNNLGTQVKSGAEKIGNSLTSIITLLLKAFSKVLGILLTMGSLTIIFFLLIGIFTLGSNIFIEFPWQDYVESGNYSDYPFWTFGLLMFLTIGIPFFFLSVLGFKLISPNSKSLGNIAIFTLVGVWIISLGLSISLLIKQANAFAHDGRIIVKENLKLQQNDTLLIKFVHNNQYAKSIDNNRDFKITQDSLSNEIIYSNEVSFKIEKTDEQNAYILIEKEANGESLSKAKYNAEQIRYNYKIIDNQLILDNYLVTDKKNKFRDQEITVTLFLPKGTLFKADSSIERYDESDNDFFDFPNNNERYTFLVTKNKAKCLDCPADYNELDEDGIEELNQTSNDSTEVVIKIKGKNIIKSTKGKGSLVIDENGVIIKTN